MGGAMPKPAPKKAKQPVAEEDSMFGFDFDSVDDLQDELEERLGDAMKQANVTTKRCVGCMDTLFYDYLLEMAPNKDGFKSAYETAKGILNLSDYGPPYLEDRNMDLLEEVFDVQVDLTLVHSYLSQKADPNFTTLEYNHNTSLHWCCFNGHDTCLPMLLKAGADVNARNKLQQTPLMLAAAGRSRRHVRMVRALLRHGADVNVKDKAGNTAIISSLMGMTTEHTLDMVRLLLKHGATVYHQHKYLKIPEPDPVEILGARIRQKEELQLLEGHAIIKLPRALRSPDEKLYDFFRVRQQIARRRAELADEAKRAAERQALMVGRVEQRHRRNTAKKQRAKARLLAQEQQKWEEMRRGVAMGVEEEVRAGFGPKKPSNEDEGKEWAKQGGMAWRVRTGHGRHASESEERLENFKQKLRDIKNKADREAAAGRAGVKQQRQQANRPKDSQPRQAESQELGSSAMNN